MSKARKRSTGKISLTILFSGLVIFTVIATTVIQMAIGYRAEQRLLFDTTLKLNQRTAERMAASMDSLVGSMKRTLAYGAEVASEQWDAAEQWDGTDGMQERLDLLRQGGSGAFNSIIIVKADGLIWVTSPEDLGLAGSMVSTHASKEALDRRTSYISKPYIGPTGRLIVMMAEPITAPDGRYLGSIMGSVYLQEANVFNEMFGTHANAEQAGYTFIVDSGGNLVYHPDKSRIGDHVSGNPVVRELMEGRSGVLRTLNTQGEEQLAAYAHVEANGWGIVSQTPISAVDRALAEQMRNRLYSIVPIGLLLIIVAAAVAGRLAEPFVSLSGVARKLSEGEPVQEWELTGHWNREANALSDSMLIALRALSKDRDRLTSEVMTDSLTGLWNRRAFDDDIAARVAVQRPFALLVMDIDRFKAINDTLGHTVGDEVLRFLADMVRSVLRPADRCYRYGGEEFVVLLEDADADSAVPAAERVRRALEAVPSPTGAPITVSIGVAGFPAHGSDPQSVFRAADAAMYRAKQEGRNRTRVAERA